MRWSARRAIALVAFSLCGATAGAETLDTALLDQVLQKYTRPVEDAAGVRVNYRGLAQSADWRRLVANLAATNPDVLATRKERLAFWINAYNILAIDLVVRNQPIESIRDIGSLLRPVWDRTAGRVGGRNVSLAGIEHETLRPMGEPRIHVAIVCASVSCPPLNRRAWSPVDLDEQFDSAMRNWLADPFTGLRTDVASDTLYLSRVFEWFEDDFAPSGGVIAFIKPYLRPADRAWLDRHPKPRIRSLPYDWNLNGFIGPSPPD